MFVEFDWMGSIMGSPIMLVLLGGSVITLGVALERMLYFRKLNGDAEGILADTLRDLRSGRVDEALARCRNSGTPLGAVAVETMECHLSRPADTEETMQVALSQQKLLMERNTGVLGTMAAVAPLIGLLGTVWGIMRAFHDMASTGSAAPSVVAAGVAEALVTTAAGLVIAVPAVLLYNHFNRRMTVTLTVAENYTRSIRSALADACSADGPTRGSATRGRGAQDEATRTIPAGRREPVGSVTG